MFQSSLNFSQNIEISNFHRPLKSKREDIPYESRKLFLVITFNNRLSLLSTELGVAENEQFCLGMAACWRNESSCSPAFITDLLQKHLQLLAAATTWANCLSLCCEAVTAGETKQDPILISDSHLHQELGSAFIVYMGQEMPTHSSWAFERA